MGKTGNNKPKDIYIPTDVKITVKEHKNPGVALHHDPQKLVIPQYQKNKDNEIAEIRKTPESYFYKGSITMQRLKKKKSIQELDKKVTKEDEITKIQQVN